jgi:hypothetical protein
VARAVWGVSFADDLPEAHEALFAQGTAYVAFARKNPALFRNAQRGVLI